jgi:hypothetical protein
MGEYGRYVQNLVEYCKKIEDDDERQQCAESIIGIMAEKTERTGNAEEFMSKLWNHLAAIANYELDIQYPVEIEKEESLSEKRENVPYPQRRIKRRHYGAIVEDFTKVIEDEKDDNKNAKLSLLIANHMKRDLSNWNPDAMSDAKVVNDLNEYTDGKAVLDTQHTPLVSDGDLLSSRNPTTVKKKRKK